MFDHCHIDNNRLQGFKNNYVEEWVPLTHDRWSIVQQDKYLSKIELKSGYHQVWVKEEDTYETTFKTRQGLYEWLVLIFFLCDEATTFMNLMNDILCNFISSFFIVYSDDLLVYIAT